MTSSLKQRAAAVRIKVESILEPAESFAISGHISLLLQHYYKDSGLPDAVMDGLSLQWLECLESFPEWAVKAACIEYLKADKKGRKPTPGQIVDLASTATSKYTALLRRCRQIEQASLAPPPKEPKTPEQLARINEILREAGLKIKTPELQEKAQQKTCPTCGHKPCISGRNCPAREGESE